MLLEQQAIPIPSSEEKSKEMDTRKFSMNTLTHQLSEEEDSMPYSGERDEDFTRLIERNSSVDTGMFSASPSRKVSKISNSGLAYIQEEDGSIERSESLDFESYSGDSNI